MMTKIHLVLVFTVVSVALYMWFLYNEIKLFQDELHTIKKQVHSILNVPAPQAQMCQLVTKTVASVPVPVQQASIDDQIEMVEDDQQLIMNNDDDDDDDVSVSSNDIKDILTNIQDTDDAKQQPIVVQTETQIIDDLSMLTEEELNRHTFLELRDYLRKNGQGSKGSKQNLVEKILSINRKEE